MFFDDCCYCFKPQLMQTFPIVNDGSTMIRVEHDWVKLKGLGNMMVQIERAWQYDGAKTTTDR
jgi:hypothetical protein